jgi:3-deoxy-D-manno-octulosonate 8-phosphate phosphatase (KDO 8-P phosphatase)
MNVLELFKPIKLIVLDVDGVLTDGNLLIMENGHDWLRQMNIKDGYALQLAVKKGYHVAIVSGSYSIGVEARLKKLGIKELHFNIKDKLDCVRKLLNKYNLMNDQAMFMGDDIPDYAVMKWVGLACCPADAAFEIKEISQYQSASYGGRGCVRDVIQKILTINGHWDLDAGVSST